ncbi:MAG: ATP-binding cassette domain-containing protein [Dehalococcoidales bacterium]|nr:ATP-binding cassette domain-containing protein [Dehalococcoidales bacterium]
MIKIEHISKDLGEFFLKDVSLDINDGEYFMLLGPTGAGKTILLETIAGIYHPDKGRIILNGRDITNLPPRGRNIGMVYQDYMLFPYLTVEKNIRFGLRSKKIAEAEVSRRVDELASLLGISHLLHRYSGTMSGGEQQRVAIARALIMEPEILLLDEPLSALDNETRGRLREELRKIHSLTQTTMIHVTHSFDEAFMLGNQMAIMNQGGVVQVGEPSEVFRKPNSRFAADFLGVTNLFRGEATIENGISYISVNGVKMVSSIPKSGPVYVSIRPEDILVSLKPIDSSARNSFAGNIEGIADNGVVIKVTVNVGVPFIVVITRRSFDDLHLENGMLVYITFKASAVHIFS